jgi:hypothetical protein
MTRPLSRRSDFVLPNPHSRLRRTRHVRVPAQWQPVTTVIPLRLMLPAPPFSEIVRRNGRALELTHLVTNHSRLAHRAARSTSLGLVREDPGFWGTTDRNGSIFPVEGQLSGAGLWADACCASSRRAALKPTPQTSLAGGEMAQRRTSSPFIENRPIDLGRRH